MVRLTLDRGERCALNRRCEDGKGRAQGTRESLAAPLSDLLLDFASYHFFLALPHAELCFAVEERRELISLQLRKKKKTTHCWLALCCALGLSRHWSGALDGNIENTYCFEGYHGEIG